MCNDLRLNSNDIAKLIEAFKEYKKEKDEVVANESGQSEI